MLTKIIELVTVKKRLAEALDLLYDVMQQSQAFFCGEELNQIQNEYEMLKQFMLQGYKDKTREQQYQRLIKKTFFLALRIEQHQTYLKLKKCDKQKRTAQMPHCDISEIRQRLENYVQDMAMADLMAGANSEQEKLNIRKKHQEDISNIFDEILFSNTWNQEDGEQMTLLVTSPTIDVNDAQLLVSALMMSHMNFYDTIKLHTLLNIYIQSQNQKVKQRALVGWALTLPDNEIYHDTHLEQKLAETMALPDCQNDLAELQMQVIYCLNARKDSQDIQDSIMNELITEQRLNIIGEQEDKLQEILQPDAAEKSMEKMEEAFGKMSELYKNGVDVYFGGFSQMKKFPFFYKISNWFYPFTTDHPSLHDIVSDKEISRLLEVIVKAGTFCDSDKYSFAFTLEHIYSQLPQEIKNAIGEGAVGNMPMDQNQQNTAAYIRRMYLQDIYRFFMLYPIQNEYYNPFSMEDKDQGARVLFFRNPWLLGHLSSEVLIPVSKFLYKQKKYASLLELLHASQISCGNDLLLIRAACQQHLRDYDSAANDYKEILRNDSLNAMALKGLAQTMFYLEQYDEAENHYATLLTINPENQNFIINHAISQLKNGHLEEAIQTLYKIEYTQPQNIHVLRALIWGELRRQKLQQAERISDKILSLKAHDINDIYHAGLIKWLQNDIGEAARIFKKVQKASQADHTIGDLKQRLAHDKAILKKHQISDIETIIMMDIVREMPG